MLVAGREVEGAKLGVEIRVRLPAGVVVIDHTAERDDAAVVQVGSCHVRRTLQHEHEKEPAARYTPEITKGYLALTT